MQSKSKQKKYNYKTEPKLHPIFTSVKYACGGILRIESMLNSYQTLSLKVYQKHKNVKTKNLLSMATEVVHQIF